MGKAETKIVKKKESITDLIGNSISITESNGDELVIPSDKAGNRVANMILAAQIRAALQNAMKQYKDKDMLPTPKDLKDLAEAAKSLHQFSGDVYREDDGTPLEKETSKKKVIKMDSADNIDFGAVTPAEPTKTDGS